jgi:ankyrin repeat protein
VKRSLNKIFIVLFSALTLLACTRSIDQKLITASAEGDQERVIIWLEGGANINARANDDWTPLTIAARKGHVKVVELLLDRGADINKREGGGHTALFWAKKYKREAVIQVLMNHGAREE